jgi:hypothetical protein
MLSVTLSLHAIITKLTLFQGGQAFPIKLRPTKERSTSAMLLEPPYPLNGSDADHAVPRWRQMK